MKYIASLLFRPVVAYRSHFAGLFVLLLLLVSAGPISEAQATDINVGSTAKLTSAKRLGINISGQTYYDSGQMLRNLVFRNPGFEGETWQTVVQCDGGATATSCTQNNQYAHWPVDFVKGASFEFLRGAALGETGTITGNSASSFALGDGGSHGFTLTFAPLAVAPQQGDFMIVRMTVPGNAAAGWWPQVSGGATLTDEFSDLSPNSPGKQCLRINAAGAGQSAGVSSYFDSFNGRTFVQLKGTYTLQFRAKGVGGSNVLNVSANRLSTTSAHGNETFLNQNLTLTGNWQDYSLSFTGNEDGTYVGAVQVSFTASGASLLLDDVSLTPASNPGNPTAFRDEVVSTLKSLQPGVLRYMDNGTDFGSSIDNMLAPPFARQRAGYTEEAVVQEDIPLGLHEFLTLCQTVGAEPWYTMPVGMTPTEAQNLIEYLAGDASTPYGAKRAALGQVQPWTTVFPAIHLELGNEIWNWVFNGEAISDFATYGNRAAVIFGAARASKSYDPGKFDLVLSSWAGVPWYSQNLMANSDNYDTIDAAPYLFNNLTDFSSNEAIFGPMFAQPEMVDSLPTGYMAQQAATAAAASRPAKLAVYEVNLSTVAGTAPQSVVNSVVPSVGAGIAVAEHMLLMMRDDGVTVQNLFCLPEYINGFSNPGVPNETTPLWGAVVDMGVTNLKRPQYLAVQLANSAIMPTLLTTTATGANPTWNQPLSQNDSIQLPLAHYLQSFAFTDGTHKSVVVFNLSRSQSLPVTFSGPNAPSGNVQISQLTSANLTDTNETSSVVNTTHNNVSNFQPATPYSLPPFSMTVFLWPGSTLPATSTILSATPTAATAGQTVTFSASVTSQSGNTTGTVTFYDGVTALGTGTLNASGTASFSTTTLTAGSHSITASYGGDTGNAGSVSSSVTVTVTAATPVGTTTTLAATPTTATTGQTVSFTATVAPQSGTTTPTGIVTFHDGATALGTGVVNASGTASFSTTSLTAGSHSITASYGGDAKNNGSTSAAVAVSITQSAVGTTTTLAANPATATTGQTVSFTATVAPQSGTTTPTGTVTFYDGATALGTGTLNAGGTASFSTTALTAGSHSITASYGGDAKDNSSTSAAVAVSITQSAVGTTTTLAANPAAATIGQTVSFTATVTPQSGTTTPTGTVTFYDGATALGTGTLNASGAASFSTTALTAGSHSITASYGGDAKDNGSTSAAVAVSITQSAVGTTTTLAVTPTTATTGQTVSFTATVAPQSGTTTPTGTVTFHDGATALGTGTLNASGTASFSTTTLTAGSHSITASYGGDAKNNGSTSAAVAVSITQNVVGTTTTLTANPATATTGQTVSFTATVAPQSGTMTPTGTVTFYDGATALGTGTLNASGTASFSTTTLAAGSHSITASYGGDAKDNGSTSAAVAVSITASPATVSPTTTTLVASTSQSTTPNSVTQVDTSQSVIFNVSVSAQSGGGIPTGSITVYDGATALGTASLNGNGTASVLAGTLTVGTHLLTAAYSGDARNAASVSPQIALVVSAPAQPAPNPDYSLNLAATNLTITKGQSGNTTIVVTPQNGFAGDVSLACSGLPAALACSFTPATVSVNGAQASSTITIQAAKSAAVSGPARAPGLAYGLLMPWGLIPLLGVAVGRRRAHRWVGRLAAAAVLVAGSLWMSGCGYYVTGASALSKAGTTYTVTITASTRTAITHTSQITVKVLP